VTLNEAAEEVSRRLARIFLNGAEGKRGVFGQYPRMQSDLLFRDHILFYEYHGDEGRGVRASHQTDDRVNRQVAAATINVEFRAPSRNRWSEYLAEAFGIAGFLFVACMRRFPEGCPIGGSPF
jgi:hypothetical protein